MTKDYTKYESYRPINLREVASQSEAEQMNGRTNEQTENYMSTYDLNDNLPFQLTKCSTCKRCS
jgi:hypothetical protein